MLHNLLNVYLRTFSLLNNIPFRNQHIWLSSVDGHYSFHPWALLNSGALSTSLQACEYSYAFGYWCRRGIWGLTENGRLVLLRNCWSVVYSGCNHLTEKSLVTHSSTLACKIPWMEKSDRLQLMGSLRVREDWDISLSLFTFMHWRRKWQPTSVFLPGESQGRESLADSHLWGRTESDTTDVT